MNFQDKDIWQLIAIEEYIKKLQIHPNYKYSLTLKTDLEEVTKVIEKKSAEMYEAYHQEQCPLCEGLGHRSDAVEIDAECKCCNGTGVTLV